MIKEMVIWFGLWYKKNGWWTEVLIRSKLDEQMKEQEKKKSLIFHLLQNAHNKFVWNWASGEGSVSVFFFSFYSIICILLLYTFAKIINAGHFFRTGKCIVYGMPCFSSSVALSPPSRHCRCLQLFSWRPTKPPIALFSRTRLRIALHFPSMHVAMLLLGIRFSRRIRLPDHFKTKCLVSHVCDFFFFFMPTMCSTKLLSEKN